MIFFSRKCDFFCLVESDEHASSSFCQFWSRPESSTVRPTLFPNVLYRISPDVLMLSCGVSQGVLLPLAKDVPLPCVLGAADSHSGHLGEMATMTVIRKGRGKAM